MLTSTPPRTASQPNRRLVHWVPGVSGDWENIVTTAEGIVNLAGASIAAERWTARRKLKLMNSRIDATRSLVNAMSRSRQKPQVLINASAVGYSGRQGEEPLTKESPGGDDYFATLARLWEHEAMKAPSLACERFVCVSASYSDAMAAL